MKTLKLSAIRLVGFHNYEDELIRVRGDLFVVGTNESGKTTVLDALHLALSGGQNFDWNSAAKMAGRRDEGRTLQGIILRADLSGKPRRKGGSITYAAVEFEPVDGNGRRTTLLFGASAADMHSRVRRWGAITSTPAAELPLTAEEADGSRRILNRDELDVRLSGRFFKSMSAYRTAVADLLFDSREDYDRVTDLWRKAKSYRELSKAARSLGDVFREVLPAPQPEAFDKVAKGFRDVAEIEEHLRELSRDARALRDLRTLRDKARDARETVRRYRYVQAKWRAEETATRLNRKREEKQTSQRQLRELTEQLSQSEREMRSLKEQLSALRAQENYQTITSLDEFKTRVENVSQRVEMLGRRCRATGTQIDESRRELATGREELAGRLAEIDGELSELAGAVADASPEIGLHVKRLQQWLPASPEDEFRSEPLRAALAETKQQWRRSVQTIETRIDTAEQERVNLQVRRDRGARALERLSRHADLVPELPGLDDVLNRLREQGIAFRLLYQELEYRPDVTAEQQAVIETALGLERLATVVVPPGDVPRARQIVLDVGQGLRVLDANSPESSAPGNSLQAPSNGTRLLDLLDVADGRVAAHLEATVGEIVLQQEPSADGASEYWYVGDGRGGEPGARWRVPITEPRWIGAERRRELAELDLRQRTEELETLDHNLRALDDELGRLRHARQILGELPDRLDRLDLTWGLKQAWDNLRRIEGRIEELDDEAAVQTKDLKDAEAERDGLSQTIATLESELHGTDADSLKDQVWDLEQRLEAATDGRGQMRTERQQVQDRLAELDPEIRLAEEESAEAEQRLDGRRQELLETLPTVAADSLDAYVFEMQRGSEIKQSELEHRLQEADRLETELLTKLRGADGVLNNKLATRYGFRIDEDRPHIEIRDRRDQLLDELFEERQEQEQQWRESLQKRHLELFEQVLAGDLTSRLRSDLAMLERMVREINEVLHPLVFGHIRFQLTFHASQEHAQLIRLVEKQSPVDAESREQLRNYLEDRKDQLTGEGEVPPFLDYRNWFHYKFSLQHVRSEAVTSLGSEEMIRGSGGAQSTHHYLLLFALSGLLFNRSRAKLRLLMMDEAFYGLDSERKELLLRCAKSPQLDLDFIIASPDLDGTIQEDAGDSTTVLVERDEQDHVTLLPLAWEQVAVEDDLGPDVSFESTSAKPKGEAPEAS